MQEKLRHDVTTTTSRRSDSYVGTQFQEHPAHYQVNLISIFGDKKTKKGAILNVKPLFCSVVAPSVPMNRTMKPVSKDIETGFIFILEFCVLWCTWEWNHVADILHTGYEENQTLETETETCVWA